jgi:hypothetical protein
MKQSTRNCIYDVPTRLIIAQNTHYTLLSSAKLFSVQLSTLQEEYMGAYYTFLISLDGLERTDTCLH